MASRVKITEEQLRDFYLNQRLTITQIAEITGSSCTSVSRYKKKWNIPTLDRYESMVGERNGNLLVVSETRCSSGSRETSHPVILHCLCDCGKTHDVSKGNFPATSSCGCSLIPDIFGEKFNRLTVLGWIKEGNTERKWICECDCGKITEVQHGALKNCETVSCGCKREPIIPNGTRFSRLEVKERVWIDGIQKWRYRCLCDCGTETFVPSVSLKRKLTTSCGCYNRTKQLGPPGERGKKDLYNTYVWNDKKRNLGFNLTLEEAAVYFEQNCHYCGIEPTYTKTKYKNDNSKYKANGIDRVDNSKGYIEGNMVPCCTTCNKAKLAFSAEEFIQHSLKIYETIKDLEVSRFHFTGNVKTPVKEEKKQKTAYARHRNLEKSNKRCLSLTNGQILELLQANCTYCNKPQARGIDRIDTTKGYLVDNVFPSCSQCNRSKLDLTLEEFKTWAKRFYVYQTRKFIP